MAWEDTLHKRGGYFGTSPVNTQQVSDELLDELVVLRLSGMSYRAIGEKVGRPKGTVYQYLQRHRRFEIRQEIPKGYVSMYHYGKVHDIAPYQVRYQVTANIVRFVKIDNMYYLCKEDTPRVKKRFDSFENLERIKYLLDLGVPKSKIAKELGCATITIQRYLAEYNLKD